MDSKRSKRLKVTLVVPNFRWTDSDVNALWQYFPYNLCMLAAMIEDRCDVNILDAYEYDWGRDEFKEKLKAAHPDVVGTTVLMDQYAAAGHEVARIAKDIDSTAKVVLGGVYATMNSEKAIEDKNIDFVIIGEGEYVLKDLIGYFMGQGRLPEKGICFREDGRIVNKGRAGFVTDLDALPRPAYHLIDYLRYANRKSERKSVDAPRFHPFGRVVTSRGCPFSCSFCQVGSIMGRTFRARSVSLILDEIQWLRETYGIKSLVFDDDNLFTQKDRAKKIFSGMIERKLVMPWKAIATAIFKLDTEMVDLMRKSGCEYVDVAIESGTERILKQIINKPVRLGQAKDMIRYCRQKGIFVAANFIIGFPTETWAEILQTVKFAEDIDADYVKLFIALPLPQTRLWELCEEHGAFKKDFQDARGIWTSGQVIETEHFSADDLTFLRAYEWDRINFTDPVKRKKISEMMGVTEEELYDIRKRTMRHACQTVKKNA